MCFFSFFFSFCLFSDVVFSEFFFGTISAFCLYREYVVHVLSFRMVFFYLVTTGWILTSACVRMQSIKKTNSMERSGSSLTERKVEVICIPVFTLELMYA